jgi:DNA-binding transcriptional ArsR family regulator
MSLTSLRSTPLSETDIHDILSNDRRRRVIEHLQHHREVSLRDLSVRIAEVETGESPPPSNIRNSVYVSLHQTHLPKLDTAGIVDYDKDRKTITLKRPARQANIYMEVVTRYGITWSTYYRTLSVISLLTVVFSSMDVVLLSTFEPFVWGTIFLAVLAISTIYQFWTKRWLFLLE